MIDHENRKVSENNLCEINDWWVLLSFVVAINRLGSRWILSSKSRI